ncbi:MAG TPA: hypothetical protein ENN78_02365, partial [Candidatus Omnitrophica bacterium]|nr:hypothetical protein [Candidatus Omnitrophota bacterium]
MKIKEYMDVLQPRLDETNYKKLSAVTNPKVYRLIAEAAELCAPQKIFICSDSSEDIAFVRRQA